jgi:hypothetical protein
MIQENKLTTSHVYTKAVNYYLTFEVYVWRIHGQKRGTVSETVLRAQNFAKFWSVSIIQPDIKGISSEFRS